MAGAASAARVVYPDRPYALVAACSSCPVAAYYRRDYDRDRSEADSSIAFRRCWLVPSSFDAASAGRVSFVRAHPPPQTLWLGTAEMVG